MPKIAISVTLVDLIPVITSHVPLATLVTTTLSVFPVSMDAPHVIRPFPSPVWAVSLALIMILQLASAKIALKDVLGVPQPLLVRFALIIIFFPMELVCCSVNSLVSPAPETAQTIKSAQFVFEVTPS